MRKNVQLRKHKAFATDPRQRQACAQQRGRADDRKSEQHERVPERKRRCCDGDRRQEQNDERVGDAAGEKKEPGQLKDVVAEKNRRGALAELQAEWKA